MDYIVHLHNRPPSCNPARRAKIIPPRPKPGERKPRPYSSDDLNALYATAFSQDWQAMVTLNAPPSRRITSEKSLRETLQALKCNLTNWHRRYGFPAMLVVTEFDLSHDSAINHANFHIGLQAPLTEDQESKFQAWWLKQHSLNDNKGRAFSHDCRQGGPKLQSYLSKDVSWRGREKRYVKFPVHWLPQRTDFRPWFTIGCKRHPAYEGGRLRQSKGSRRSRFESAHGNIFKPSMTACTGHSESAHGPTYITPEAE